MADHLPDRRRYRLRSSSRPFFRRCRQCWPASFVAPSVGFSPMRFSHASTARPRVRVRASCAATVWVTWPPIFALLGSMVSRRGLAEAVHPPAAQAMLESPRQNP